MMQRRTMLLAVVVVAVVVVAVATALGVVYAGGDEAQATAAPTTVTSVCDQGCAEQGACDCDCGEAGGCGDSGACDGGGSCPMAGSTPSTAVSGDCCGQ